MIPGITTKLSEDTIALSTIISPKADLIIISDTAQTTTFTTILPSFGGGFSGKVMLVNRSGATMVTSTAGNILAIAVIPVNLAVALVFSKSLNKWVVGAIS